MKQLGHIHDVILFYTKTDAWKWNPQYTEYDESYIQNFYRYVEEGTGRRFRLGDLTAAKPGGDTSYEWKGVKPYKGRFWAYSQENMRKFDEEGRLYYTKNGMPCYKRYLDEMPGVPLQDLWLDINPIGPLAAERLGYPTQKPEALLERIIASSSDEGDTVLDPFCGCGTAIAVAQRTHRRWIGIDVTHLAVGLIKQRLKDAFGDAIRNTYEVIGEPASLPDAAELAKQDPFQFQAWALSLVGARTATSARRGADHGIDGRLYFHDDKSGDTKQIIFSVKSGHVSVAQVRDLRGVLEREKAEISVFITLESPSKPMIAEATEAGFYTSEHFDDKFPRLQILTIGQLLSGASVRYPRLLEATFKKAPKAKAAKAQQQLDLEGPF